METHQMNPNSSRLKLVFIFNISLLLLPSPRLLKGSMTMIQAMKDLLKRSTFVVSLYQKIIGYKPNNEHWCRIVMNNETTKLMQSLNFIEFQALEISGSRWKNFGFGGYKNVFYPEFDICKNSLDEKFDVIVCEQVFEHLTHPYRAGKNVYKMLKSGGYFLITTPFLLKVHQVPFDCTRWTPEGMAYFLEECGFELKNIQSFGWGNKESLIANLKDWMPYNKNRHSLHNDPLFPLVVWALAKK